ncbi:MAG TPA: hypothetical protein VFR35_18125 [Actinoplanes sp.]|nr:hypothetical protein [Actinoplanes sp.]
MSTRDGASADVDALADRGWGARSYRETLAELILLGWAPCGLGDWAVALRSPDGRHAARISPFDPAYPAFLELCRRCAGNRYLPHVDFSAPLTGGGSLAVLEFLAPAPEAVAAQVIRQWRHDEGDADLRTVRAAALVVDEEFRARQPWWDGIDLNRDNVRRGLDGRLALIDIFCMDGAALYGQILEDPLVVRRLIPPDQRRHLLEIPYLARESSPAELRALHDAWRRRCS